MPDNNLSKAIEEAYASAPVDSVILATIELRHSAFVDGNGDPAPIRVIADYRDWTGRLEATAPLNAGEFVNFTAYAFEVTFPSVEDGAQPELEIKIDNVSQEIIKQIDLAAVSSEKVELTARLFLTSDVDINGYFNGPQNDPPIHLSINYIKADIFQVLAKASFDDISNKAFPGEDYTAATFPGLVR